MKPSFFLSLLLFLFFSLKVSSYSQGLHDEMYGWGNTLFGNLDRQAIAPSLSKVDVALFRGKQVKSVHVNRESTMILFTDGTVIAHGRNLYGQFCADPSPSTDETVFLQVPGKVKQLVLGETAALYWLEDNRLYLCTIEEDDDTINSSQTFETLRPLDSDAPDEEYEVTALYSGRNGRIVFITKTGKVFTDDKFDEGDFDPAETTLGTLLNLNITITDIFVGEYGSFFVMSDNVMYATGQNDFGQLGTGSVEDFISDPMRVALQPNVEVKKMAHGSDFNVILSKNGTLYTFGNNDKGQLGRVVNTKKLPNVPSTVFDIQSVVVTDVFCGTFFTIALTNQGVFAFGDNSYYQLTTEAGISIPLPTRLSYLDDVMKEGIVDIRSSDRHSYCLTVLGNVYSFGYLSNIFGFNYSAYIQHKPSEIFKQISTKILDISIGRSHTIFSTTDGVFTAGYNRFGALGNGDAQLFSKLSPIVAVEGLKGALIRNVSAGASHSVILTDKGVVYAFGSNLDGQVSTIEVHSRSVPFPINFADFGHAYQDVFIEHAAAGYAHTVAVSRDKQIFELGNRRRQVIDGSVIPSPIKKVVAGNRLTFILTTSGSVYVHGANIYLWHIEHELPDVPYLYIEKDIEDVAVGHAHALFLTRQGSVLGAGSNVEGQLCEKPNTENRIIYNKLAPVERMNTKKPKVKFIGCGLSHSVFVMEDDTIYHCGDLTFSDNDDDMAVKSSYLVVEPAVVSLPLEAEVGQAFGTQVVYLAVGGNANYVIIKDMLNIPYPLLVGIVISGFIMAPLVLCGMIVIPLLIVINCVARRRSAAKLQRDKDALLLDLLQDRESNSSNSFSEDTLEKPRSKSIAQSLKLSELYFIIELDEISNLKKIGEGVTGTVLKGMWKNQQVALKLFRSSIFETLYEPAPNASASESNADILLQDFRNEVELMNSLKHPNIVGFYGVCFKRPHVGIVMEYCSHGSLAQYISTRKGKIDFDTKIQILLHVARGMNFLHVKNIIHRDLKCDNILIDENNVVKIADFGLARSRESGALHVQHRMTVHIGTGLYMAPEVTLGEFYDSKCDVFSFAIIMFELLAETLKPYGEKVQMGVEQKVARNATYRPILPESVQLGTTQQFYVELMMDCWRQDPFSRPDFGTIVARLEKYLRGGSSSRSESTYSVSSNKYYTPMSNSSSSRLLIEVAEEAEMNSYTLSKPDSRSDSIHSLFKEGDLV